MKGATFLALTTTQPLRSFNPRPHEGGDDRLDATHKETRVSIHAPMKGATHGYQGDCRVYSVSIHAPMKGATSRRAARPPSCTGFNPRPHEGGDLRLLCGDMRSLKFQSTPP